MKRTLCFILTAIALAGFAGSGCSKKNPVIEIETPKGNILIELYLDKAPVTAGNFLKLVKDGVFDGGSFYRTVRERGDSNPVTIRVLQGGIDKNEGAPEIAPITHETTDQTGIRHLNGVVSMARGNPGTATSEFFICLGDQPELDIRGMRNPDGQGFAAFGKVIEGMTVVEQIWQGTAVGQTLNPPVRIHKIRIR